MKRMLIVEDDFLSQKVLIRLFQKEFEIDICESADEFYDKFSKTEYDIIIMDISLKGNKSGIELITEIKARSATSSTPILCLTPHAFARDREAAINNGADLFLTKPVANDVLKDAVKHLAIKK